MDSTGKSARKLSLVAPGEELTGSGPVEFERLGRTASRGSAEHLGLITTASFLARRAAQVCVPPSAQTELKAAFSAIQRWIDALAADGAVKQIGQAARDERARLFAALPAIEQATARAIEKARERLPRGTETLLDDHADLTVLRFCRLSAHHATAAACHCLDALEVPTEALRVPSDSAGALAYQSAALGSARHQTFRRAAVEQAEWEHVRDGSPDPHGAKGLALLIFHEYLGARWKAHGDLQRQNGDQFIAWALSGRP